MGGLLYLRIPTAPLRQLRGFNDDKAILERGGHVGVDEMDLSVWDIVAQKWKLPSTNYMINIGAKSPDLRLNTTFKT